MLLFGSNAAGWNNYIHDCLSKGIGIVIHGNAHGKGHASLERVNIRAEGNVVERCGNSIYFWTGLFTESDAGNQRFEDISISGNYFINSGQGWCVHNQMWTGNEIGEQCQAVKINSLHRTGEVMIVNNLFYRAAAPLIDYYLDHNGSDTPTMRDNTYVQDEDQVMFFQRELNEQEQVDGVLAKDGAEALFRQFVRDSSGMVVVK